jgi:putative membrane protein
MRSFLLITALLTLCAAWFGPLPRLARDAFFAHMTLHMAVVAVAAPLLAIGIAAGRFDLARIAPRFFAPIPASIAELVVVWVWHTPYLHHAARHHTDMFVAEQVSFLAVGFFLWLSAIGGDRLERKSRSAAGVVGLLLTAAHMTLLGALLALSSRPLYRHVNGIAGLTPLDDQHLGGAIMLVVGGLSYLIGGLYLTARVLRQPVRAAIKPR